MGKTGPQDGRDPPRFPKVESFDDMILASTTATQTFLQRTQRLCTEASRAILPALSVAAEGGQRNTLGGAAARDKQPVNSHTDNRQQLTFRFQNTEHRILY